METIENKAGSCVETNLVIWTVEAITYPHSFPEAKNHAIGSVARNQRPEDVLKTKKQFIVLFIAVSFIVGPLCSCHYHRYHRHHDYTINITVL